MAISPVSHETFPAAAGGHAPPIARRIDDAAEFEAIVAIRREVFAWEQGLVSTEARDTDDPRCVHAVAVIPWERLGVAPRDVADTERAFALRDGLAVASGRLKPAKSRSDLAQIAWVATRADHRGQGAGAAVMRVLVRVASESGAPGVLLSAQAHAIDFYRRLGFAPSGRRYLSNGVPHQNMVLELR